MFSTKLDRRRQFNRLAFLAAATLLAVGIALIAFGAVRAFNMLEAADSDYLTKKVRRDESAAGMSA